MRIRTALLCLLAAACGDDDRRSADAARVDVDLRVDAQTDTPTDAPIVVPGEVTLAVLSAAPSGSVGEGMGLLISLRLSNGTAEPIPAAPSMFRLVVEPLQLTVDRDSTRLPDACPSDALVTSGGSVECSVLFDTMDQPSALIYQGPTGPVSATVPEIMCMDCGGFCVDTRVDPEHCGECFRSVGAFATCVDGEPQCTDGSTFCEGECVARGNCTIAGGLGDSCDAICGASGLRCESGGAEVVYICGEEGIDQGVGCADMAANRMGCELEALYCLCEE